MNNKILKYPRYDGLLPRIKDRSIRIGPVILLILLLMCWFLFPLWLRSQDPTAGYIDQNIWLLIGLSLITFLLVVGLCWWLLKNFWTIAGLPSINQLIIKFNHLPSCQQLNFFYAWFALLILAALSCIHAIC